ncbi:tetratricopeptide repeat protein 9C-like [Clavelina lepadiformis]|uniref:tetratricopeptide repeat protein 9C-like n=1 Tax=Clavelina lepadiformis TaxID=159417 RepID=UPI004041FF52
MPTPSETSSSPTPSTSSRMTQQWPESMTSIRESVPEVSVVEPAQAPTFAPVIQKSHRRYHDDDDDDDELLVTSGDLDEQAGGKVGLFDVVKREFRCKTAVITNRAAYEDPNHPATVRKPKVNFIQDMKAKVGIAMELKNKGMEDLQHKEYREATKYFHRALLHIKGLDPDEGVVWNAEFEAMDKDKMPLRVMPNELKDIKEAVEIDCYLNLAVCLMHKERVPYRRIKEYCLKVLDIREDHVKALTRAGMACYYLREYEVSRFYLQSAKDLSHEPMDLNIKKYLQMVENQLIKASKGKK